MKAALDLLDCFRLAEELGCSARLLLTGRRGCSAIAARGCSALLAEEAAPADMQKRLHALRM